jgi:hypothetical protein
VPWLLPTLGNIQETPYTFKTPEDFSCRPNRPHRVTLPINHWSNDAEPAVERAIVNAHDAAGAGPG